ncbi:transposase [Coriobacteriia bacterium Es71-Z0120]|uniref:IS110 family transposase n=1 Tax=Parvivirga hydrogeniphila TaxID=2939460 RepID=UPI002260ABE6|nr:transposase [Parvivirga hydrogeniphila]MCL4078430.1 transposase [Parvivirga hydrogeniphila]
MNECTHIGLDVHKDTISVAVLRSGTTVIAPSMIPRRSGVRVKTDRIDARDLARLHRAGELTSVRVPGAAEEAVRDLIRVREEVKCDRRIARQRIRSFLMRYGKRYPGPRDAWSHRFEVWARSVTFDKPHAQEAFANPLSANFIRDAQLAEMGKRVEEIAMTEAFAADVARL